MKNRLLIFLGIFFVSLYLASGMTTGKESADLVAFLTSEIPPRPGSAMTGSEFAQHVSGMDKSCREQAIEAELTRGNIPNFLRKLKLEMAIQM